LKSCYSLAIFRPFAFAFLLIVGLLYANSSLAQVNVEFTVWDSVESDACKATITFLSEKEYLFESGDQIVTKAYKFNQYRKTDFYVFFQRTIANNEQLSCSGVAAARVGTRIKYYAKFNEEMTEMEVYPEPDEEETVTVRYKKRGG